MKLKRILLRYHPPGIGLECVAEDGEQAEVVHKDLPPAHEVGNLQVIQQLVTSLLEEETLLQKKKHEKSLIQLLGRLYQIDTSEANVDANAGTAGNSSSSRQHFPEAAKVICVGFSGSNAVYNGSIGTITKVFEDKKTKYEVTFDQSGTIVKVKENHLLHVLNDGFPYAPGLLPLNTRVVIAGLRNHGSLNGTVGRVVDFTDANPNMGESKSAARYEVRAVDTGQLFRVKPDNILAALGPGEDIPEELALRLEEAGPASTVQYKVEKPDLTIPVGAVVELINLRNAGWLNGQLAEVLSVDHERRRYEIRLSTDDTIKKVKAENVQLAYSPGMHGQPGGQDPSSLDNQINQPIAKGTRIELCNLKTAAALNGERAVILSRDGDRYEIRLELDGSAKQVRRDNFKVIAQPMV
ncbi:unnamed protein product [Amoebophrya sp. A120]|nr:unnamed protein product [Amoebophrya sp. A120]|eukprot:GSA120T00024717001.1